jgi:hypothetical protein
VEKHCPKQQLPQPIAHPVPDAGPPEPPVQIVIDAFSESPVPGAAAPEPHDDVEIDKDACSSDGDTSSGSSSSSSTSSLDLRVGNHQGRHGKQHRQAIQSIIPYLRRVLAEPGSNQRQDRANVNIAVSNAQSEGICFWGRGKLYSSKHTVVSCIVNMYYSTVSLEAAANNE